MHNLQLVSKICIHFLKLSSLTKNKTKKKKKKLQKKPLLKLHSENINDFWHLVFIITTNKLFSKITPLQKRRLLFMPKKYATQRLSKLALPRLLSHKGFLFS